MEDDSTKGHMVELCYFGIRKVSYSPQTFEQRKCTLFIRLSGANAILFLRHAAPTRDSSHASYPPYFPPVSAVGPFAYWSWANIKLNEFRIYKSRKFTANPLRLCRVGRHRRTDRRTDNIVDQYMPLLPIYRRAKALIVVISSVNVQCSLHSCKWNNCTGTRWYFRRASNVLDAAIAMLSVCLFVRPSRW